MVVIFFLIHFISSPHGCIRMPQERHPIATLFDTFFINPVGYEAFPRQNGFVGIPCSRGAFYVTSHLSILESPLHTGCLVKHICLSHVGKVTISFLYLFNPGFSRLHFNRIRLFLLQLRLACAHALLGDQKDCCAKNKDRTNNVEDCGTHATSGWKG